jgi:hypothetical protein
LGFPKVIPGTSKNIAGRKTGPGGRFIRVTGGARLNSASLRYPTGILWADYSRALTGVVLCGAPLLLVDVNRWLGLCLGVGLILFVLYGVRTAMRQKTRYTLDADELCAEGAGRSVVEWARLDRLKLNYYSTKRDRSDGWMQLSAGSVGGRLVKIDSSLDGFHDIVERAAHAAEAAGVELSDSTRVNLRSMGIMVAERAQAEQDLA